MALVERPLQPDGTPEPAPIEPNRDYGAAPIDIRLPVNLILAGAITFLVGAILTFQLTNLLVPTYYVSSVRLLGIDLSASGRGVAFGNRRMQSVQQLAESDLYLVELARRAGTEVDIDRLREQVDAYRPGFLGVIYIEMRGKDAEEIERLGQQLVPTLEVMIDRIRSGAAPSLDDNGRPMFEGDDTDYSGPMFVDPFDSRADFGPLPPPATKNAYVGGFGSVLVMLGVALALHAKPRVTSREDLEVAFRMPFVASMPKLGFLPRKRRDTLLRGAAAAVDTASDRGSSRIITVAVDGTRRSNVSSVLALGTALAANCYEPVIFLDLDPERASLSRRLGRKALIGGSAKAGLSDSIAEGVDPATYVTEVRRRRLPLSVRRLARQGKTTLGVVGIGTAAGPHVLGEEDLVAEAIAQLAQQAIVVVMLPRVPGPASVQAVLTQCDVALLAVLDGWSPFERAIEASEVINSAAWGAAGYLLIEN